jgi:hypothetical protein
MHFHYLILIRESLAKWLGCVDQRPKEPANIECPLLGKFWQVCILSSLVLVYVIFLSPRSICNMFEELLL